MLSGRKGSDTLPCIFIDKKYFGSFIEFHEAYKEDRLSRILKRAYVSHKFRNENHYQWKYDSQDEEDIKEGIAEEDERVRFIEELD